MYWHYNAKNIMSSRHSVRAHTARQLLQKSFKNNIYRKRRKGDDKAFGVFTQDDFDNLYSGKLDTFFQGQIGKSQEEIDKIVEAAYNAVKGITSAGNAAANFKAETMQDADEMLELMYNLINATENALGVAKQVTRDGSGVYKWVEGPESTEGYPAELKTFYTLFREIQAGNEAFKAGRTHISYAPFGQGAIREKDIDFTTFLQDASKIIGNRWRTFSGTAYELVLVKLFNNAETESNKFVAKYLGSLGKHGKERQEKIREMIFMSENGVETYISIDKKLVDAAIEKTDDDLVIKRGNSMADIAISVSKERGRVKTLFTAPQILAQAKYGKTIHFGGTGLGNLGNLADRAIFYKVLGNKHIDSFTERLYARYEVNKPYKKGKDTIKSYDKERDATYINKVYAEMKKVALLEAVIGRADSLVDQNYTYFINDKSYSSYQIYASIMNELIDSDIYKLDEKGHGQSNLYLHVPTFIEPDPILSLYPGILSPLNVYVSKNSSSKQSRKNGSGKYGGDKFDTSFGDKRSNEIGDDAFAALQRVRIEVKFDIKIDKLKTLLDKQ